MVDEVVDQAHEEAEGSNERFISVAAVVVAVIATFMALCGVKADNMDYGILQQKSDAVDMWAMYQAKSMKQYMYKLQRDSFETTLLTAPGVAPAARAEVQKRLAKYNAEIDRYEQEKEETSTKAKEHEANVERMNRVADLLDMTEVFLSLAIALLAITILTRLRWMLVLSLVPSAIGVFFGLAALAGWSIEIALPGFLT
ncbi:MAG: DUF4337 domain-containing protein [Armatimonadetes bacterium]|nr:DUF4337 domain-containing protein [Armatimonadota bacterium]